MTIDESDNPYGEATTDAHAIFPGGHLYENFECVSKPGFGVAQISFEIQVPEDLLVQKLPVFQAHPIDPILPNGSLPDVEERPVETLDIQDDDVGDVVMLPSPEDDDDQGFIDDDFGEELDDMFDGVAKDAEEYDSPVDEDGERVEPVEELESPVSRQKEKKSCVTQDAGEVDITARWLED